MISKKEIAAKIVLFIFAVVAFAFIVSCSGCKSFEPIIVEGQPAECNDFYTVLGWTIKAESKDAAFAAVIWRECLQARKEKERNVK